MLTRAVTARLPTGFGEFQVHAYRDPAAGSVHLALVRGTLQRGEPALVRIHSECLTGDGFASTRCDCGPQLDAALARIAEIGAGVLVYLRQEGRGIGLLNKLMAYNLQDAGLDTVDANLHLGFPADSREYACAVQILADLGVSSVRLLTNNPDKIAAFDGSAVRVVERVPIVVGRTRENAQYLETKRRRLGHYLTVQQDA